MVLQVVVKRPYPKKIIGKIKNGIILSTDNYYKVGLISKFLSKFVASYFDRSISFNYKLFKKDFNFNLKNGISIQERSYNFEKKIINNFFNETNNINFLLYTYYQIPKENNKKIEIVE